MSKTDSGCSFTILLLSSNLQGNRIFLSRVGFDFSSKTFVLNMDSNAEDLLLFMLWKFPQSTLVTLRNVCKNWQVPVWVQMVIYLWFGTFCISNILLLDPRYWSGGWGTQTKTLPYYFPVTFPVSGKMGSKPGNWEGLRKAARGLENEIDTKLVTFSKLGTSYSRGASGRWDEITSSHAKIE